MKSCNTCGVEKPATEFYKRSIEKDGLGYNCKTCANRLHKEWTDYNPVQYLLNNRRYYARRLGVEFTITVADFPEGIPQVCPVLGIPLIRGSGKVVDGSPTIDRVDLAKGYIPGNVRIISYRANRIKNDASAEELLKIVAYMNEHLRVN